MLYKKFTGGMMDSNSYIIGSESEVALIDCGGYPEEIMEYLRGNGLKLKYIILTHCHIDHIAFISQLRKETGAKVCIGVHDAPGLLNDEINLYRSCGLSSSNDEADILLDDNSELQVGDIHFSFMETPGHTAGGICIYCVDETTNEKKLFTGDTLFKRSIGRTDFINGSSFKLKVSIEKIFKSFDENTIVHPGHGDNTTIGDEIKHNPYRDYL